MPMPPACVLMSPACNPMPVHHQTPSHAGRFSTHWEKKAERSRRAGRVVVIPVHLVLALENAADASVREEDEARRHLLLHEARVEHRGAGVREPSQRHVLVVLEDVRYGTVFILGLSRLHLTAPRHLHHAWMGGYVEIH